MLSNSIFNCLLCARRNSKHLISIAHLIFMIPMWLVLLFPFSMWKNWGTKRVYQSNDPGLLATKWWALAPGIPSSSKSKIIRTLPTSQRSPLIICPFSLNLKYFLSGLLQSLLISARDSYIPHQINSMAAARHTAVCTEPTTGLPVVSCGALANQHLLPCPFPAIPCCNLPLGKPIQPQGLMQAPSPKSNSARSMIIPPGNDTAFPQLPEHSHFNASTWAIVTHHLLVTWEAASKLHKTLGLVQNTWVWVPALPLTSYETLGNLLNFSVLLGLLQLLKWGIITG